MRTSKRVLAMILALTMIFSTAMTSFAAPGEGVQQIKQTINVKVTMNDLLQMITAPISVYEVNETTGNNKTPAIATGWTVNGEIKFEFNETPLPNLKADAKYRIEYEGLWALDTAVKFVEFTTDGNGNIVEATNNVLDVNFVLKPFEKNVRLRVESYNNKGVAEARPFEIRKVKVTGTGANTKYVLNEDKTFIVDDSRGGWLWNDFTNASGLREFFDAEISGNPWGPFPGGLIHRAGYTVQADQGTGSANPTTVVAFLVSGRVVAFADLRHDTKVVLRDAKGISVKVNVSDITEGMGFFKAIPNATVEVQSLVTDQWGAQAKWEKQQTGKTNVNGSVTFDNVEVWDTIQIWTPTGLVNSPRPARVVVTGVDPATGSEIEYGYKLDGPEASAQILDFWGNYDWATNTWTKELGLRKTEFAATSRISGPNRYATSVEVARETFGAQVKGAPAPYDAIIVSGDNLADALVANSLVPLGDRLLLGTSLNQPRRNPAWVKKYGAPLLLTASNTLSPEVKEYLEDIGAKDVLIVGGKNSVTGNVQATLEGMGIVTNRITGADRYETSTKVLDYLMKNATFVQAWMNAGRTVMLASGETAKLADSLLASVPSAMYAMPILLTTSTKLPASVDAAFNKIALPDYVIKRVIIVGGEKSVSNDVMAQISISNIERLSGQNRQLTSMKVADEFFTLGGQAIVVNGQNSPDALSAGQHGYGLNAPILLTETNTVLGTDLAKYIQVNKMTDVTIIGGMSSVSTGIRIQLEDLIKKGA